MWLLPPDFPADAFDLPPGTWALPWYADEQHIAALMRLLIAGEARIREWAPLPWAALESAAVDAPVRTGAAVVLRAPTELTADEIVPQTRSLPWPYVFWHSSRPAIEGEGAWLEREIKGALLSELHRSVLDPTHPLARFHIERLPLDLAASMVADPVDVVEIIQAAILHRLGHARDGLRREDYHDSLRWAAGRHLGGYLLRIPAELRAQALGIIERGGRGEEDRASFRRAAQAIQDVGLGLCVGEDMAMGPLARCAADAIVWAGIADRAPNLLADTRRARHRVATGFEDQPRWVSERRALVPTMLPSLELLPVDSSERLHWLFLLFPPEQLPAAWAPALFELQRALLFPRRLVRGADLGRAAQILSTEEPTSYRGRRLQELLTLLLEFFDHSRNADLERYRSSIDALVQLVATNEDERTALQALDPTLVEHALIHRPRMAMLERLDHEARARTPMNSWSDAIWAGISAEVARLRGHANAALASFDEASHRWAARELDGRSGWLQSRVSAACAALEALQPERASRILDLLGDEPEESPSHTVYAMVPLLRGLIVRQQAGDLKVVDTSLMLATRRFHDLRDVQGEQLARAALAEHHIATGDLSAETEVEQAHEELGRIGDVRGRAYTELVLGKAALLGSRVDKARAAYREAIRLCEHVGDDRTRSIAYHELAVLEAGAHRHDVAEALELQALKLELTAGQTIAPE